MFHLPVPLLEKIVRPVLVYCALIVFLRLFGKRELAQLNPFDLVVLLSLSNTVQNAIIGDDNSLSGGLIGAFALLAANWLLNRLLFRAPRLNKLLQGTQTVLIRDGEPDEEALRREILTREELLEVLHKQSINSIDEVRECSLQPSGTFFVEKRKSSLPHHRQQEILDKIDALMEQVQALRFAAVEDARREGND